jgi:cytochrome P460
MRRCCFFILASILLAADQPSGGPQFTPDGQLMLPKNYREWVFLTSGLGMTYGSPDAAAAQEPRFDNVFVTRAAYQSFVETGRWPDKTMLVLEVRTSDSKASINKGGRFQTELHALEAEVKSGGKWTFYGFGKGASAGKQIPASASCYSCHAEHGAVDNTFVQFYPTLLTVARAKGTLKP